MDRLLLSLITLNLIICTCTCMGSSVIGKRTATFIPENDILPQRNEFVQKSSSAITSGRELSGARSNSRKSRMINGTIVNDHVLSHIVSLNYETGSHACGGTILHPQLILTAAHCFMNKTSKPAHIKVSGANDVYKTSFPIKYYIPHELFNATSKYLVHDIGILVLESSIPNPEVVRLAQKNTTVLNGTIGISYGWGRTSDNGTLSEQLRSVKLPILHPDICAKHYVESKYRICTDSHGSAICKGDSGGPLFVDENQIGIVSGYKDTCISGLPSAFTNVPVYREWIDEKIKSLKLLKMIE